MSESLTISVDFAGIGMYQTCAVEFTLGVSSEAIYRACSGEGPIFDVWHGVFGA